MRFEIPVILEVEASDIHEARELVYRSLLKTVAVPEPNTKCIQLPTGTTAIMADDNHTIKDERRVVVLHPGEQSIEQYEGG